MILCIKFYIVNFVHKILKKYSFQQAVVKQKRKKLGGGLFHRKIQYIFASQFSKKRLSSHPLLKSKFACFIPVLLNLSTPADR